MLFRFLLTAALAVSALPAAACSVASGYRVPTTLELVREADVVAIAYPASASNQRDTNGNRVLFVMGTILKDDGPSGPIERRMGVEVFGALATSQMPSTPSDPGELVRANPEAYGGSCNRYIFREDMPVLLFLKRGEAGYAGYTAISYPFARTMEDAPGVNGRWAKTVREYVAIASLPMAVQRARLEARRDMLKLKPDADSKAIAADMDRELNAPRKPLREPLPPVR